MVNDNLNIDKADMSNKTYLLMVIVIILLIVGFIVFVKYYVAPTEKVEKYTKFCNDRGFEFYDDHIGQLDDVEVECYNIVEDCSAIWHNQNNTLGCIKKRESIILKYINKGGN